MSSETDQTIRDLVSRLIPIVKKRITIALDRSREDVEYELATLSTLLIIEDKMGHL